MEIVSGDGEGREESRILRTEEVKGQEQGDVMRREMAGLKIQRYDRGNAANEMQPCYSGISARAWRSPLAAADHSGRAFLESADIYSTKFSSAPTVRAQVCKLAIRSKKGGLFAVALETSPGL